MIDEYYLFTFESTHGAISTEKLLKPVGCTIMPVPRAISTSCGIAVRIEPDRLDAALPVFRDGTALTADEYRLYHIRSDKASDLFEHTPVEV
ncbi:MAG: DUF3343 domain-containing protein [Mogibacterium sp.]|nr:DUF3343 domain-containing protein [Mogibacterium sp.]